MVTYRNSFYKLEPTQQLTVQDGGLQRQAAQTQPSEDKLTIASYNIENFSANNAKNETPEDKVTLIANSFIHEIHNPDIITLIEECRTIMVVWMTERPVVLKVDAN